MRLTCIGIVFAMTAFILTAALSERTLAQIPERVIFQPGSYAGGAYGYGAGKVVAVATPSVSAVPQTEWETVFGEKQENSAEAPAATAGEVAAEVRPMPYLAYHKNPITGRIHIVPYQKGYPDPEEFPQKESHLKFALSALPSMTQDQPQIEYLGYYDPMPEIIEDKPSRLQLILGYPNSAWTSPCDNRWGTRQAQCIGIEQFPNGPYAEQNIKNQAYDLHSPLSHFGPLQPNAAGFRGNLFFNRPYPVGVQTPLPAGYPAAHPQGAYPQGFAPEGFRPRIFSRLGAYQPAVGERYESNGYNHSWNGSSCAKTPHSSQCKGTECPIHSKTACKCSKCSPKKECKTEEPASDVKTEEKAANDKTVKKTAVKEQKPKGSKQSAQKKSVAPPKKDV